MQQRIKYIVTILVAITSVVLVAYQIKLLGWALLAACFGLLPFCSKKFAKHIILVLISLGILGITPIDTDIHTKPALLMSLLLSTSVLLPYLIAKYVLNNRTIRFSWHHGRGWYKTEVAYILLTASVGYLLLPFYLKSTHAYLNWPDAEHASDIIRLFIGTNALGIWDELFFVCVVLSLLKKHVAFWWANAVQAIMWTAFLHELGFVSWIFAVIFLFALLQGYIFKKTESLLYIITIHLTLDFVLFLALLNSHNSNLVPIFIT